MAVYVRDKFVSSKTKDFVITENETIQSLVAKTQLPEVLNSYLRISINGTVIDDWSIQATPRDVVYIALVPQGGGDGKNPLAMIAMVALTFVSGPLVSGIANVTVASGVQAGIMFVGSLAISALFPPPTPKSSSSETSPFLGISGQKNTPRPGEPVMYMFGQYRVSPDLAVEPYIITENLKQTIYAIYDFGYGTINLSDISIGNTKMESYHSIEYAILKDYTTDTADKRLTIYQNDNSTESLNSEIRYTGSVEPVVRNLASNTREGVMTISFPYGLATKSGSGDDEAQGVRFTMLFGGVSNSGNLYTDKNIGRISSPPPPAKQHPKPTFSLNVETDTVLATSIEFLDMYVDYDGTDVFGITGYSILEHGDTYTAIVYNDWVSNQNDAIEPYPPGVDQTFTKDGVDYALTSVEYIEDSLELEQVLTEYANRDNNFEDQYQYRYTKKYIVTLYIPIPENASHIPYSGRWVPVEFTDPETGDISLSSELQYLPDTTTVYDLNGEEYTSFYLERNTRIPFTLTINVVFPEEGDWHFSIWRNDKSHYDDPGIEGTYADKTDITSLRSIGYRDPLNFRVGHTILEMKIVATNQLNGMVDNLSATAYRELPVYNGTDWLTQQETSNPAWVVADVLCGEANPDPISYDRLDQASFLAFAEWCDILKSVDEFPENDLPSNTVNGVWTTESTAYTRVNEILSSSRATLGLVDNKYTIIWENFPRVPVQLFTPKNSWNFSATKKFVKEPHGLKVSFIDPYSDWQSTEVPVYSDGYDETNAVYFEPINLPLCTNYAEAYRNGRYFLAQGKLRPEIFTITTDIENLVAERGGLVNVQHDVAQAGGFSSRITAINGNQVTTREPFLYYTETDVWQLLIRNIDGGQEYFIIESIIDEYTVQLSTTPTISKVGDLVVYGIQNQVIEEFLVKSIQPSTDLTATLTLVPMARAIESADAGEIPEYNPPVHPEILTPPSCVVGLLYQRSTFFIHRVPHFDIKLTWGNMGPGVLYDIWIADDAGYTKVAHNVDVNEYQLYKNQSMLGFSYPDKDDLKVKVIPKNTAGKSPIFDLCKPVVVQLPRDNSIPGKPLYFSGDILSDAMVLTWLAPLDEDISGYVLKYTSNTVDPSWESVPVLEGTIPHNKTTTTVNARIGSYMLKTLDTSGNYSGDFGLVKTSIPSLDGYSIYNEYSEDPDFLGGKNRVVFSTDGIRLDQDAGEYFDHGIYTFANVVDLGDIYRTRISQDMVMEAIGIDYEDDINVVIEVKTSSFNQVLNDWPNMDPYVSGGAYDTISQDGNTDWSGWSTFYAGTFTGRYFAFRAILTSVNPSATPHVTKLYIKFEMPQRTETGNNIDSGLINERVDYTSSFIHAPAVGITQDDAGIGDYYIINNKDEIGFNIVFFNSSNTQIYPQFDYMATGIGEKVLTVNNQIEQGAEDDLSYLAQASTNQRLRT